MVRPATDAEVAQLKADVKEGKPFRATGTPRPAFQQEVVRNLVVGGDAPRGVHICGAAIEGVLNLRNARGAGQASNALILEHCVLLGDGRDVVVGNPCIDAAHSHLARLALVDCELGGIELSSAVVDGDLTLDGSRARDERSACWVKASGIRIGGSLGAGRATLSLPWQPGADWPPADERHWANVRTPFALDLDGARIGGSLVLQPAFEALGGVIISGATIGGDLWANGAHLASSGVGQSSVDALRAQSAHVEGHAALGCDPRYDNDDADGDGPVSRTVGRHRPDAFWPDDGRFEARGIVNFYGAEIGGTLVLSGAKVTQAGDSDLSGPALNLFAASVSIDVWLDGYDKAKIPFEVSNLELSSATIGGKLFLEGSRASRIEKVDAAGVSVGHDLQLFGSLATTQLTGSMIGGNLEIWGDPGEPIGSVDAATLRIRGDLTLAGSISGRCNFSGSLVDGDVRFGQVVGDDVHWLVLDTTRAVVQPSVELADATVGRAVKVVAPILTPAFPIDLAKAAHSVRSTELRAYPGWKLAEALLSSADSWEEAILAFLYRPGDRGEVVVLNGESAPIHLLNERQPPALDAPEQVKEYLSFFCNYVWADEGAFRLVEGPEASSAAAEALRVTRNPDGTWRAEGHVEYGLVEDDAALYGAVFTVFPTGEVEMVDDEPLVEIPPPEIRYDAPLRWVGGAPDRSAGEWPVPPPLGITFAPDGFEGRWKSVLAQLRRELEANRRPYIDLQGLRAASLSDGGGANWGPGVADGESWGAYRRLRLELHGFRYDRIDELRVVSSNPFEKRATALTRRDVVARRRKWLEAQYTRSPPTADEYQPQPYQQLAKVWRVAGEFSNADDIAHCKLELENARLASPELPRWRRTRFRAKQFLWRWGVQFPFGYGLRPKRATVSLLSFWAVGVAAMFVLSGALKVDAAAVATVADPSDRVVIDKRSTGVGLEELPCEDHVNQVVYPLDVMIPLIDLREESRCQLSIKGGWLFFDWGLAKGAYAVVGWLVLIGFIITWSGVVRRRIEA